MVTKRFFVFYVVLCSGRSRFVGSINRHCSSTCLDSSMASSNGWGYYYELCKMQWSVKKVAVVSPFAWRLRGQFWNLPQVKELYRGQSKLLSYHCLYRWRIIYGCKRVGERLLFNKTKLGPSVRSRMDIWVEPACYLSGDQGIESNSQKLL